MERGGERLPRLRVCGAVVPPSSLVSFVLCISMIKRWWSRAAGRSLDTETMLSLEQASTAAEQPPRDRARLYTPTPPLIHVDKHVNTRRRLDYYAREDLNSQRCCTIRGRLQEPPDHRTETQRQGRPGLSSTSAGGPRSAPESD